jgi:TRAP-type uncharacterized transport system substrate-binding protein
MTCGFAAIAIVSASIYFYERPTVLHVAVARDSDDQAIMAAAAREFAEDQEWIRLKVVPVDDVAESSRALDDGRADLAIVRTDVAMPPSGQTVLIMRHNAVILVAPAEGGLHEIADLPGHRIGVLQSSAEAGAGDQALWTLLLGQYDIAPNSVQTVPLSLAELPDAIERKEIDAVFAVGVQGDGHLADAIAAVAQAGQGAPEFIPIGEAEAIAQRSPSLNSIQIVRGVFGGASPRPAANFESLAVSTRLVARKSLSVDLVSDLTRLLLTARPTLAANVPVANRIEAPDTEKGATWPVHPGTLAYLDDDEKSFFEKYGDFIYIGAMFFSLIGTGAAAVFSQLKRRMNEHLDADLQRIVDLVKAAREAQGPEALDAVAMEADELLARMLAPASVHAMGASRIGAFGLAFDQVRYVIAERQQYWQMVPRPAAYPPRLVGE